MMSLDWKAGSCCPHRDYGKVYFFPFKFISEIVTVFFQGLNSKKKSHNFFTESFLERQKTFLRFVLKDSFFWKSFSRGTRSFYIQCFGNYNHLLLLSPLSFYLFIRFQLFQAWRKLKTQTKKVYLVIIRPSLLIEVQFSDVLVNRKRI